MNWKSQTENKISVFAIAAWRSTKTIWESKATAVNIFIMTECEKRESDAPAEPYRDPSRPVSSLVKTLASFH